MLSNVELKIDHTSFPELVFDFTGRSMCDYSNEEKARKSISPNDKKGGTSIYTEKSSSIEKVSKEIDIDGNYYIVIPFLDGPFLGSIKAVNSIAVKFCFLNPDKHTYPDQYLRFDEIKSIHKVTRWSYCEIKPGRCHCGVDGDYCGSSCLYPENNPDLKGGRQC